MPSPTVDDFFQLVERASDLILIVRESRIVYANPAFAFALGYARDELNGLPATQLAHPEERQSVADRIEQTMAGGGTLPLRRRRLLRRDGSEINIEASTFPMEFGGAAAAVLVGRDLTALQTAERESRAAGSAVDQLRASEAMTAKLVAGVVHEVRNPLFGMSATLDAMERRFGTGEGEEPFLRALRRELERLTLLMRDLLEYGKPPALHLTTDSLGAVVALAVRSCTCTSRTRLPAKRASFRWIQAASRRCSRT